eukprot:3698667-Amphidinium_carterae.1
MFLIFGTFPAAAAWLPLPDWLAGWLPDWPPYPRLRCAAGLLSTTVSISVPVPNAGNSHLVRSAD